MNADDLDPASNIQSVSFRSLGLLAPGLLDGEAALKLRRAVEAYDGTDSVPTGGRKLGVDEARSIGDRDSPFDDDDVTYDICGGDGNDDGGGEESSCFLSCYELKDVCDNHYFEYCPEFKPTPAPST